MTNYDKKHVLSPGPSTKTPSPAIVVDWYIIPTESLAHPLDATGTGPGDSGNRPDVRTSRISAVRLDGG
jgi:hypothetical protein